MRICTNAHPQPFDFIQSNIVGNVNLKKKKKLLKKRLRHCNSTDIVIAINVNNKTLLMSFGVSIVFVQSDRKSTLMINILKLLSSLVQSACITYTRHSTVFD